MNLCPPPAFMSLIAGLSTLRNINTDGVPGLDQSPIARPATCRSRDPHMPVGKRRGHGIKLVAGDARSFPSLALGVDHGRYALRTTSVPVRAYNATPADKGFSRCLRFFEVPPKDTSAELPSDLSLVARTSEDRGGDPRSSKLANPLTAPMGRPAVRTLSCHQQRESISPFCASSLKVWVEASNAQRKQSYRADTENQHDQRDGIIVEPMCHAFMTF
jgi:hypothetical protein